MSKQSDSLMNAYQRNSGNITKNNSYNGGIMMNADSTHRAKSSNSSSQIHAAMAYHS